MSFDPFERNKVRGQPLYRRYVGPDPCEIDTPDGPVELVSGDALRTDLLVRQPNEIRGDLEPAHKAVRFAQLGYHVQDFPPVISRDLSLTTPDRQDARDVLPDVSGGIRVLPEEAAGTACVLTGDGPDVRWEFVDPPDASLGWLYRMWREGRTPLPNFPPCVALVPSQKARACDVEVTLATCPEATAVLDVSRSLRKARNEGGAKVAVLIRPGAWVPPGLVDEMAARASETVVRPVGPDVAPLAGASGSAHVRMPYGRSRTAVALAAAAGVEDMPSCQRGDLLTAPAVAFPLEDSLLDALDDSRAQSFEAVARVVAESMRSDATMLAHIYAWCPPVRLNRLSHPFSRRSDWSRVIAPLRARIAAVRPYALPVHLWTVDIGAWGGVHAILRVAEELDDLGLFAQVGHHSRHEHNFAPSLGFVRFSEHRNGIVAEEFEERTGGVTEGLFVATHWWSGRVAREVIDRHPGMLPVTFWQDREDLFTDKNGKAHMSAGDWRDYLGIDDGASVSRWILDSAAEELGADVASKVVIPCGVDTRVFRPAEEASSSRGPVRVLAMWRPTTTRRGHKRLQVVLDLLKRRLKGRVSLELFGEDKQVPAWADRHHGWLSQDYVAALMREVDVVVEPSDYQGFGLPGLEAMASGAALVSTQCRGVDEYAVHEENALVVPHNKLLDAVERTCTDEALRLRLRRAGPETARRFDWRLIGARWCLWVAETWRRRRGDDTRWEDSLRWAEDRARARLEEVAT